MRGLKSTWVALLLLLISSSWAATFRSTGSAVFINEIEVFRLKATLDGLNPEKRAAAIVATLRKADLKAPLRVETTKRGIWLRSGEVNVVRVTPEEARLQGVEANALMARWRERVEFALSHNVPVFEIGLGETREWRITGVDATAELGIDASDPRIATVERNGPVLLIHALEVGECFIRVVGNGVKSESIIKVTAPLASRPSRNTIYLEMFAHPVAPTQTVSKRVRDEVVRQFSNPNGQRAEVLRSSCTSLKFGEKKVFPTLVRVFPTDKPAYDLMVDVVVTNNAARPGRDSALWYSNAPESVREPGILFNQDLKKSIPVRMLYHHMNASAGPMTIRVVLYNLSTLPAKVLMISGDGSPHKNPVLVGMNAGDQFLRKQASQDHNIVTVPPRSYLSLSAHRLEVGVTISGLASLNLLDGPDRLVVRTEAFSPMVEQILPLTSVPFTVNPPAASLSDQVFESPFKSQKVKVEVPGRPAFVRMGQTPIGAITGSHNLSGNYGVTYTVEADVFNTANVPKELEVLFEASAGYSGVVFQFNQQFLRPSTVQTKAEVRVGSLLLQPKERKKVTLVTLPLSGSSYPATITFRAVERRSALIRTLDTITSGP